MGGLLKIREQPTDMVAQVDKLTEAVKMLYAQNSELAQEVRKLTKEVHRLKTVTPAQAKALTEQLHERAALVCIEHGAEGGEKKAGNAIRKKLKEIFGIDKLKELPRDDYPNAVRVIKTWDDWTVMKKIRKGLMG